MIEPVGPRDAIVRAAADLFRRQGYAATGLNEILRVSGAPKGSLYHYFPGGKAQLGAAALTHAGGLVEATLGTLDDTAAGASDLVAKYAAALAGWMHSSDYRQGNPIATTVLEQAPGDPTLTAAARSAYEGWTRLLARRLAEDGVPEARSARLARLIVAAFDGALIQARLSQSPQPIMAAAEELQVLILAATQGGPCD